MPSAQCAFTAVDRGDDLHGPRGCGACPAASSTWCLRKKATRTASTGACGAGSLRSLRPSWQATTRRRFLSAFSPGSGNLRESRRGSLKGGGRGDCYRRPSSLDSPASPSSSGAKSQLLRTQGDPRCRCELRGVRRALLDRYQRPILGANGGPRALTRSKRKPA